MEVQFLRIGSPFFLNPFFCDYVHKRITKEEYIQKTNEYRPPPFVPFSVSCRVIRKNANFLDVETLEKIFLSNGCGPTIDLRYYRLHPNGDVSYFYNHSENLIYYKVMQGNLEPENWSHNIPKWFVDSLAKVRPILDLILLSAKFDKKSIFGQIPMDVVRLIIKAIFETRFDPVWVFTESKSKRPRKRIKR
jgi:hypothetical protein